VKITEKLHLFVLQKLQLFSKGYFYTASVQKADVNHTKIYIMTQATIEM